jgi:hypothetical protein
VKELVYKPKEGDSNRLGFPLSRKIGEFDALKARRLEPHVPQGSVGPCLFANVSELALLEILKLCCG